MALARTEGCAIIAIGTGAFDRGPPEAEPYIASDAPKCSLVATQRPGSTQNTLRSTGSLSAGTMRSLPITRSCLPPVTISPASNSSGRLELFTSTSRFTCAPSFRIAGIPCRRNQTLHTARLGNHHISRAQPFVERQKLTCRITFCRNHRKYRQIAMPDRFQHVVARRRSNFSRTRVPLVTHQ